MPRWRGALFDLPSVSLLHDARPRPSAPLYCIVNGNDTRHFTSTAFWHCELQLLANRAFGNFVGVENNTIMRLG